MKRIASLAILFVLAAIPVAAVPCTVGVACPYDLSQITVDITAAEILDSFTSPVELVPAPGAGFVVVPLRVVKFTSAGNGYNDAAGVVAWSGSGDPIASINLNGEFESATADEVADSLVDYENKAVILSGGATIDDSAGGINAATIGSGGADYEIGDTGTVTTGNGDGLYEVDTVDGGGAVTAFTITAAGTGYTVSDGNATSASAMGTGFEVDIDSITLGSRPVSITVVYSVVEVP